MKASRRGERSHRNLLDHIAEYRESVDADSYPMLLPLDALRAIVELHEPRLSTVYAAGEQQVWICGHCADLCHSRSGLACDTPTDGFYPCATVGAVIKALIIGKR